MIDRFLDSEYVSYPFLTNDNGANRASLPIFATMLLKKFYLCAKLVATLGAILHVLVYAMCRPMPCATVGTVFLHAVRFYQAAHMGLGMGSIGSRLSASDPHCGGGAVLRTSRISHLAA